MEKKIILMIFPINKYKLKETEVFPLKTAMSNGQLMPVPKKSYRTGWGTRLVYYYPLGYIRKEVERHLHVANNVDWNISMLERNNEIE